MLILKCPQDFHSKYEKYSNSEQVKGISAPTQDNVSNNDEVPLNQTNQSDIEVESNEPSIFEEPHKVKAGRKKAKNEEYSDVLDSLFMTERTLNFLNRAFEKLDFGSDDLLEILGEKYKKKKSAEIKKEKPLLYERGIAYLKQTYPNEDRDFYEMGFEDVVLIICSVIKYFMGFTIKLELGDLPTNLMMICYGNENQFNTLAEMFEYELQLKPYAYKYEYYKEDYKKSKDAKMYLLANSSTYNYLDPVDHSANNAEENNVLLVDEIKKNSPIQFENLDINKPYLWPPYYEYSKMRDIKYRRYEKNDLYHECSFDDNDENPCGKCSKFRNIDKLRLINDSLDKCLRLTFLKKKGFLISIVYKRNYEGYDYKLSFKHLLSKGWNIFDKQTFLYLINLIRNFYGEVISFYFLWMEHYIKWLMFPGALGLIVAIISYVDPFPKKPIGKSPITYLDIFLMIFCVIITIWATLFLKIWTQKEQMYTFIWGTQNYTHNEPDSELFEPDSTVEFVFGKTITVASTTVRNLKKCVSYLVLIIMIVATCAITFLLFFYKKKYLKEDTKENYWFNTCVGMGFAAINAIQIKIFNFIYTFLAEILNKWENYKKDYQRINDLAIKIIIFDFMNCYTACFYIGFYKPAVGEACVGTCIQEIGTQLYTTFLINFGLNAVEIGLPFLMYKYREYNFKKEAKNAKEIKDIVPHSIVHQMLCDELNNTIYEYNEMIILFGYVCLFSVTAPLTPLIVLILVWAEKLLDIIKMFFLQRIQILDQARGIEIYYKLLKVLMFLGMLTNIGVLLFSKELKINNDMVYKIGVFLCIENFLMILMYCLDWKIFPFWWKEIGELKELYDKKYFRRRGRNLPHRYLLVLKKKEQMKNLKKLN